MEITAARTSTRRVEEATHRVIGAQAVVELDGGARLLDVDSDAALLQQLQRLRAGLQHEVHPPAEDDDGASALHQLGDVRGLDSRHVTRARLVPVPRAPAARVQLEV